MRSGNGAEYGQRGEREQDPVQTPNSAQGGRRVASGHRVEPIVKQGFDDENDDHEDKPEREHRRHPPEVWIVEPRPQVHPVGQPEARRASDRNGKANLRGEPPLHRVEQREAVGGGWLGYGERQDDQGHEANSADPVDDGKDMQGARQNEIVDQVWPSRCCARPTSPLPDGNRNPMRNARPATKPWRRETGRG